MNTVVIDPIKNKIALDMASCIRPSEPSLGAGVSLLFHFRSWVSVKDKVGNFKIIKHTTTVSYSELYRLKTFVKLVNTT